MAETGSPIKQVSKDNLSARIYAQMRGSLMDGQFEPGERLTISNLAEQFGTSIPKLDPDRLREIQLIRVELEGAAAERAATIITSKQLDELSGIHESFLAAAAVDPAKASVRNRDFHFALLRVAQLPILEGIVENAWVLMGPFLRLFHVHIPKRDLAADQHLHHVVLEALKRHDAAAASKAIQDDIRWGTVLIDAFEREGEVRRTGTSS